MSSIGRSIRFSIISAVSGLLVGYRHARRNEDPRLIVREKGPQEAPPEPPEAVSPTAWFCDFETTMQSVQCAHYNGFVSGVAWSLSHEESFEEIRRARDMTDGRFIRMAVRFSERMTDQVAAASISGDKKAMPDPSAFSDLELGE